MKTPPSRLKAILVALLVTVIWATSWVFIKIGLEEIPGLTFAGLRYSLAAIILLPFLFRPVILAEMKKLGKKVWVQLAIMGFFLYAVGQGGQFLGLSYLPSVTVGLILNLTSLFVAMVSYYAIREKPSWLQWVGVLLNLGGILFYFAPFRGLDGSIWGWLFAVLSLLGNGVGTLMGRNLNKGGRISPVITTTISIAIGSLLMLGGGILWQGLPPLSLKSIGIIVLLASVNTALSFTLWNYTQQTLSATESSIINNTMLVHVTILTWIFLGENQNMRQIIGLILVTIGAVIVQLKLNKSGNPITKVN
jgi:drug/metabolite transporter (DMT)-like permease